MAKGVAFLASALCVLALASLAQCHNEELFFVEGKVYCDTCRVQFVTRFSHFIEGAGVRLTCRNRETEKVTFTVEGKTEGDGLYSLPVAGDHENDICEVSLLSSPDADCSEISAEPARVSLTSNSGIQSATRYANPIGFLKKETLPHCDIILQEIGLIP